MFLLGITAVAGAAATMLRTVGETEEPVVVTATETASTASAVAPLPSGTGSSIAAAAAIATASATGSTSASAASDDLPPGAEVPPGYGLIAVTAPAGARVRIDGAIVGKGPAASGVAAPGYHEVRVESGGRESKSVIEVRGGKTARVDSPLPP